MTTRDQPALIVGIGQGVAGDDGIGLLVARELVSQGVAAVESTDATVLITLLAEGRRVVVVDAVMGGGAPGDILHLQPDELAEVQAPVSSHGVGVVEALALAEVLYRSDKSPIVDIVGVVIDREPHLGSTLSPEVAAAVRPATALAARLARGSDGVRLARHGRATRDRCPHDVVWPSPTGTSRRCHRR